MSYAHPKTEEDKEAAARYKRKWYLKKLAEDPDYNKKRYAKYCINWREARRMNQLNGKPVPKGQRKRPYTNSCEVCGKSFDTAKKKSYHHWDGVADLGMWLCTGCHCMAEHIDKEHDVKYKKLKVQIELEYRR